MAKFRYKSRQEISNFLTGIRESVECILSSETTLEATMSAQRTGPHLSTHLNDLIELEMNEAHLDKDQEWTVDEISSHIVRVVISSVFCGVGFGLASLERVTLDVLDRYDAGDYSFSVEETAMNQRSEKLRTIHTVDDGATDIPELLKGVMEVINKMIGDHAEIKIMSEDDMIKMLKKKMEENEQDPEEEEE